MISSRLKKLNPYVPGEQPKDRDYVKLNANENPYGPSQNVIEAVSSFLIENPDCIKFLPDLHIELLTKDLAESLNSTGGWLY